MITTKLGRHTLEMYDSIEDLPIVKFHAFNKYMLIDSGVGGDLKDIDVHITKIIKLIKANPDAATQELMNMRLAMYYITQGVSPKHMAFVCLIHKMNGESITDLSSENVKSILEKLKNTKVSLVSELVDKLKKNIDDELALYFPIFFDDIHKKVVYDMLKQRTSLILESITKSKNNAMAVNELDVKLLSMSKPKTFQGKESVEISHNKQFENMCFMITQKSGLDTKNMTVFSYYTAVEQLKKQTPKKKK